MLDWLGVPGRSKRQKLSEPDLRVLKELGDLVEGSTRGNSRGDGGDWKIESAIDERV
jgi:hypothetical protein